MRTYYEYHGNLCYEAYCKQAQEDDDEGLAGHALQWEELDEGTRECWCKAACAVANEFRPTVQANEPQPECNSGEWRDIPIEVEE